MEARMRRHAFSLALLAAACATSAAAEAPALVNPGFEQTGAVEEPPVVVAVAAEAGLLEVGAPLNVRGKAWLDDGAVEGVGRAGEGNEPPRPLAGRGRDNLVALARLLGIVRYFHPSDGVAAA